MPLRQPTSKLQLLPLSTAEHAPARQARPLRGRAAAASLETAARQLLMSEPLPSERCCRFAR
eukprot:5439124-Prymnesium_polylepis.1